MEADEIGRLGAYRVRNLLGKGGMAFVFHAEDVTLHRPVALKVMKPDLNADPDAGPRFLREARIMASIKHDHLVTVYQVGQEGSAVYLAMELLEGQSLADWLEQMPRPSVGEILRIAQELVGGLEVIHRNGMIHRDLKPANIWLEGAKRRVKILDFGLARSLQDDVNLTQTGMVMGTPAFMSPEQARGERVDARSDLFSIGSILYLMCTGRKPFQADTTMAILTALAVDTPAPVRSINPAVPAPVSDLIGQLLSKRPEQRPATSAHLLEQLNELAFEFGDVGRDPSSRTQRLASSGRFAASRRQPWLPIAGAFVGTGLLAFVLLRLFGGSNSTQPTVAATKPVATSPGPVASTPTPTRAAVPAGDQVFLTDLKEIAAVAWPFEGKGPPLPPGMNLEDAPPTRSRFPVRIAGKFAQHGIFMHAPGGPFGGAPGDTVSITYKLDKAYKTFETDVALNDGPRGCAPMEFIVLGDGKELWRSKPVESQDDLQSCKVSVAGVDRLRIEVKIPNPMGAHAAWIEPRLSK